MSASNGSTASPTSPGAIDGLATAADVLDKVADALPDLSPQVGRAARYILANPTEVAVSSMRALADAAGVTPNTLVRMARVIGFNGYDDFREPFRRQATEAAPSFPDRARFLQSLNSGGLHGNLLADMAAAALANTESLFATLDAAELKAAADRILAAATTNVLGVGTARPLADNFAYVAGMAVPTVKAIPTTGLAIDEVARMTGDDVLIAMTVAPYRVEIVEAVAVANRRDVPVIAVSDSRAAPIAWNAAHVFTVPHQSPLPFSSNVAAVALLETLLAFVVADADVDVVDAIESFHANRRAAGIYLD